MVLVGHLVRQHALLERARRVDRVARRPAPRGRLGAAHRRVPVRVPRGEDGAHAAVAEQVERAAEASRTTRVRASRSRTCGSRSAWSNWLLHVAVGRLRRPLSRLPLLLREHERRVGELGRSRSRGRSAGGSSARTGRRPARCPRARSCAGTACSGVHLQAARGVREEAAEVLLRVDGHGRVEAGVDQDGPGAGVLDAGRPAPAPARTSSCRPSRPSACRPASRPSSRSNHAAGPGISPVSSGCRRTVAPSRPPGSGSCAGCASAITPRGYRPVALACRRALADLRAGPARRPGGRRHRRRLGPRPRDRARAERAGRHRGRGRPAARSRSRRRSRPARRPRTRVCATSARRSRWTRSWTTCSSSTAGSTAREQRRRPVHDAGRGHHARRGSRPSCGST